MQQRIWIVGSSSGIGLELVKKWLSEGYLVVASARHASDAKDLLALKHIYETQLQIVDVDVTSMDSVSKAVYQAWRRFDGLDVWFYNAAVYDGVGTLDEKFVYDDGETQTRIWTLTPTGEKTFIGRAGDIVGDAHMVAKGNTVMIDYVMKVPYKDSTIDISVRDWLHLQEDGVILNHSKMRKFGFEVGELVITIIKDYPSNKLQ
jgi:NAD(P)-dependent dehydrogenase (short-subunit alcohol dehydrogenase family)